MSKYNVIYLDPPFLFQNWTEKKNGSPKKHYNGLTIDELCDLPIKEIADDNCVMFLWIPSTKIVEGAHLKLFEAWGFKPITLAFSWRKKYVSGKPYMGIGFWCRNDVELCLLGKRGKIKRKSTKVMQTIEFPVLKPHSSKPPIVRDKIVELVGDLPRIELFSRIKNKQENGWVHAGFEVDGQDIRDALQQIKAGTYI